MTQVSKVFIVDDDPSVRASLVHLLETRPNTEVRCFPSGSDFLVEAQGLEPGGLILDLHMPGKSGIEVLETLAPFRERFGIIVLTGEADVNLAVQAMKLGVVDFLEKPCDHIKLLEAVEQALARQEQVRESGLRRLEAQGKIDALSQRERDVLIGLIHGYSNKLMAHELGISPRTIEIYRSKLMEKLGVRSLSEVLSLAFTAGILPDRRS